MAMCSRQVVPVSVRLGTFVTTLILMLLLSSCGMASGRQESTTPTPLPPQPAVERPTYTVERGNIVEEMQLSGRVAAKRQEDLAFDQAGSVAKIAVRATDTIKKGQLLAELDLGERLTQLQQAQLTLDQAKRALERGQAQQKTAKQLAELDLQEAQVRLRQAGSAAERQLAEIGVRRAQINLEQAGTTADADLEQQVAQAQLDYDRIKAQVDAGRLYAPYDGQVAAVAVEEGASVEAHAPVMTVMDPRERELRVENTVSADLQRLGPNQPVTIRFSRHPDAQVKGVIERLPQGAVSANAEVKGDDAVHITFDPGKLETDIGDLAQVTVTLQRKDNVLWLPPQAVRTFQGRRFVVVEDGGRQKRVDIKLGIQGPDRVEIAEGLKPGDKVVGQ